MRIPGGVSKVENYRKKGFPGGCFATATATDGTKRTIEVAMVATDRHLDHLAQNNVENKASGEGCNEQYKATSWPRDPFKKESSAHFDTA